MRAAPAARSPCAPPWGWRWTKERVVEDADPYRAGAATRGLRSSRRPGGGGTPPLRGVGGTWRGGRRTNVRVVEDADPYGSRQGRAACRGIYRVRVAAGEMVKMPPHRAAF